GALSPGISLPFGGGVCPPAGGVDPSPGDSPPSTGGGGSGELAVGAGVSSPPPQAVIRKVSPIMDAKRILTRFPMLFFPHFIELALTRRARSPRSGERSRMERRRGNQRIRLRRSSSSGAAVDSLLVTP